MVNNSPGNGEILSIFHLVTTDLPGRGNLTGALIFAKIQNDLIFWWKDYPPVKLSFNEQRNEEAKYDIILRSTNIQKIMINYQQNEAYLLINTIQPPSMHQFMFPSNSSYQLLQFAQLLTLHQNKTGNANSFSSSNDNDDDDDQGIHSLQSAVNFIVESFAATQNHFHLFEFSFEESKMKVPIDFSTDGLLPSDVDFVKPDLHIISQFKVISEDYVNNPINKECFESLKTIDELKDAVMNRGIEPSLRASIWPIIFNIIPFDTLKREKILKSRVDEYLSLRNQWQSFSKMQLKYLNTVREAFTTIRVDVKRTHPPEYISHIPDWQTKLTNILRTFTLWNLDVRYTQGLNDLAVNIMAVIIPYIDGDEGEALAFWCFAAFVELIASGLIADNMMAMQDRELTNIMTIIEKFHPACAKWLRTNGLSDLSFLISSFILAYGRSFAHESIARIWEALICVKHPWLFLRYFSASLLILSFPSFQKIPDCSTGKLVSTMDQIFYHQEIGALIGVSLSMMNKSNIEVDEPLSPRASKPTIIEELKIGGRVLFKPNDDYNKAYEEDSSLFK